MAIVKRMTWTSWLGVQYVEAHLQISVGLAIFVLWLSEVKNYQSVPIAIKT